MAEHNFRPLLAHYPALIEDMPNTFTSHQFIIQLSRLYQALYVRALYAYRRLPSPENPTPFQIVHGILAKHLNNFPDFVRYVRHVPSTDIFKQDETCAEWQKV